MNWQSDFLKDNYPLKALLIFVKKVNFLEPIVEVICKQLLAYLSGKSDI